MSQIYVGYELYLTASTSEGFGLTLMEAVGSGLPLIGFDVRYGNQTFIDDGKKWLSDTGQFQSGRGSDYCCFCGEDSSSFLAKDASRR